MIERQTIDGREATVAYFNAGFVPADKGVATQAKVSFDDGEVLFLTTDKPAPAKPNLDATLTATEADRLEKLRAQRTELEAQLAAVHAEIAPLEAMPRDSIGVKEQVAAWVGAIAIVDVTEPKIRDVIERDLAPVARLGQLKLTTASEITQRLGKRVGAIRTSAIKRAFKLVRRKLGNGPVEGYSLARWAQLVAAIDAKGIDTAIRTGLLAGLENTEIARKVVGSMGLNGVDGVTEFTRHKIAHLGRAAIREFIQRRKSP